MTIVDVNLVINKTSGRVEVVFDFSVQLKTIAGQYFSSGMPRSFKSVCCFKHCATNRGAE